MQYILGIDAGGTKTKCVVTNLDGKILYSTTGGAANLLISNYENTLHTFLELIIKCKSVLNFNYDEIRIALIGAAGAGIPSNAKKWEHELNFYLKSKNIKIKEIHIDNDARIALEGAFAGKPGCILIAGTGSIIYGKDLNGNIHRSGGFGRIIGDEGSGFLIGKKALKVLINEIEGYRQKTIISRLISKKFFIDSIERLIFEVYKNNFDIPSVAPLVIEAAKMNDEIAIKILDEESNELLLLIKSILTKIKQEEIKLSIAGGLLDNDNFYSLMLKEKIKNQMPFIKITEAEFPPEIGAVLLAKQIITPNY
jgi:N-acetylglucosamine kinase-like BadF-type ATPase